MYELRLTGFQTTKEVEEFIAWYEGQGEQDASTWFENAKDKGKINVDFMPVNCQIPYRWDGNTLTAALKIAPTS